MNKFKLSYSHLVKTALVAFFMCFLGGMMLITILNSSIFNSSSIEWFSIFLLSIGLTAIYTIIALNYYEKSYVGVEEDKLTLKTAKKTVVINFKKIKSIYPLKKIAIFRSNKLRIETDDGIYTLYLTESDTEKVMELLPNLEVLDGEEEGVIKLTLKQKMMTLYIWLLNVVVYMAVFFAIFLPPILGVLSKYSKDYAEAKRIFLIGSGVSWLLVIAYVLCHFVLKLIRFKGYTLTLNKETIALNYYYLGKKFARKNKSEMLDVSVFKSLFAHVFGYGFVNIATVNKKNGIGDINYFPFAMPLNYCKEVVSSVVPQSDKVEIVRPKKKHYIAGYVYLALLTVVSVVFSILYHVGFLTFILAGVLIVLLYMRGRFYGEGDEFFVYSTGALWRRYCYVLNKNVKAISYGKEFFLKKCSAGSYIIYLYGFGSQITVGVFGDELRTRLKDKLDI